MIRFATRAVAVCAAIGVSSSSSALAQQQRPAPVRPQTPQPPFPYRVDEVTFESVPGVRLAGTITTPSGPGPFPAVVLVAGSGPQERDEPVEGHKSFLVIADYLAHRGIAALRYDKRGYAKSTGSYDASTIADFADDAEAAVHFLEGRTGIARGRVGIIGHSEGALIAPMIAARSTDVAFIVLLAAPGLPGDSVMLLQRAAIDRATGTAPARDRALEANRRMFIAMRAARDSGDMATRLISAQEEMVEALLPDSARVERAEANRQLDGKRAMLLSPYWRGFLLYDPRPALQQVHVPVLALNGTLDLQVPYAANLPEIDSALKAAGNRDYRTVTMPGLNHLFQTATTGDPSEYGKIDETFSPAALDIIANWINAHAGGRKVGLSRKHQ